MIELGNPKNPSVLLVDDEPQVLESLCDLLRKECHVLATTDPEEAMTLLPKHDIALVLSDQRMPRVTGSQLLARIAQVCPDAVRVLLTGFSDIEAVVQAINEGRVYYYLTKPWDPEKLLELVRRATQQYALGRENRELTQQLAEINRTVAEKESSAATLATTQNKLQHDNETLRAGIDYLKTSFWHLRRIQEVLPICMECGKVKTDGAEWQDVIKYFKANANFLSHGYCPLCAQKVQQQWSREAQERKPHATALA